MLFLMARLASAIGQDYDADSIRYTPLKKPSLKIKIESDSISKTGPLIGYFFTLQSGTLVGCKDCVGGKMVSLSSSLVNGITLSKKARMGAGIGYDTYRSWEVMPLFGTASWDLIGNKNKNAVVLQFSYGWAKPFPDPSQLDYGRHSVYGGRMVNPQIGYRIKYGNLKLALWVGYKYQRVSTLYQYPTYHYLFNGTSVLGEPNTNRIRESLSRLQLTMSIGWK